MVSYVGLVKFLQIPQSELTDAPDNIKKVQLELFYQKKRDGFLSFA